MPGKFHKMKHTLLICILLIVACSTFAQSVPHGNLTAKYNAVPNTYNFWLYTPEDYEDGGHPMPLIVFLHGRSLCGRNLNQVLRYGVLDAIKGGRIIPAVVITPQNPGSAWNPAKIMDIIEWAQKNYSIDSTRIYALGMSLGGYGTMDLAGTYPDKIAAAMALCGGCTLKNMDKLGDLPLWIMHGTADRAVSVNCSKEVVEHLQKIGKTDLLRYDWVPGGSHGILSRCFYTQLTYDWLFAHSLGDKPRVVDRNFDITKEDMNNAYNELRGNTNSEMYEDD